MSADGEDRIHKLEVQLAHTQHLVDQLNAVVTEQSRTIDRMSRMLTQLRSRIDELKLKGDEKRDPLEEKPPHY